MNNTRRKKITYYVAENIRYLYTRKDQENEIEEEVIKEDGTKSIELVTVKPFSKERLMKKFNISSRTFDNIISKKICNKQPKVKELKGAKHLNKNEIDYICDAFKKMKYGYKTLEKPVGAVEIYDDNGVLIEPESIEVWNEPLKYPQRKLISILDDFLEPTFGYKLGYLKLYRVLKKASLLNGDNNG